MKIGEVANETGLSISNIRFYEKKQMQKTPIRTILMLLAMNGMFVFMIPSGVGLYYFVSSLFTVIEQFIFLLSSLKTHPTYDKITLN